MAKKRTLMKGGTVITMVNGDEPGQGDVLIEDDKIVEIGHDVSADAEVIKELRAVVETGGAISSTPETEMQCTGVIQ